MVVLLYQLWLLYQLIQFNKIIDLIVIIYYHKNNWIDLELERYNSYNTLK
jgi:hypothetical protein